MTLSDDFEKGLMAGCIGQILTDIANKYRMRLTDAQANEAIQSVMKRMGYEFTDDDVNQMMQILLKVEEKLKKEIESGKWLE